MGTDFRIVVVDDSAPSDQVRAGDTEARGAPTPETTTPQKPETAPVDEQKQPSNQDKSNGKGKSNQEDVAVDRAFDKRLEQIVDSISGGFKSTTDVLADTVGGIAGIASGITTGDVGRTFGALRGIGANVSNQAVGLARGGGFGRDLLSVLGLGTADLAGAGGQVIPRDETAASGGESNRDKSDKQEEKARSEQQQVEKQQEQEKQKFETVQSGPGGLLDTYRDIRMFQIVEGLTSKLFGSGSRMFGGITAGIGRIFGGAAQAGAAAAGAVRGGLGFLGSAALGATGGAASRFASRTTGAAGRAAGAAGAAEGGLIVEGTVLASRVVPRAAGAAATGTGLITTSGGALATTGGGALATTGGGALATTGAAGGAGAGVGGAGVAAAIAANPVGIAVLAVAGAAVAVVAGFALVVAGSRKLMNTIESMTASFSDLSTDVAAARGVAEARTAVLNIQRAERFGPRIAPVIERQQQFDEVLIKFADIGTDLLLKIFESLDPFIQLAIPFMDGTAESLGALINLAEAMMDFVQGDIPGMLANLAEAGVDIKEALDAFSGGEPVKKGAEDPFFNELMNIWPTIQKQGRIK